ncbi:MAG: nuclease SfsA [Anaerocolumna sp.]|jgi:sugar fermentation stimulation protein A|nr:nuclease SfsA [Anaerocolumna sp.]
MIYENIITGIFKERPNRFIAVVEIMGKDEICHVKNTGRCKELLIPGTMVFLEKNNNPTRKTKYSLIGVKKGNRLINMDSQAPNKVAFEWIKAGGLFHNVTLIKPEKTFGNSRFDLYIEADDKKIFMEVKGVTLEDDGIVRFPDAPTERGIKHIRELSNCIQQGFEAYLLFVVQMKDVKFFEPNNATHPEFGEALKEAAKNGVHLMAVDCFVDENQLEIRDFVPINIETT